MPTPGLPDELIGIRTSADHARIYVVRRISVAVYVGHWYAGFCFDIVITPGITRNGFRPLHAISRST